ncbi:MAG: NAD(P)-dependent dehydrogenase (short-subunit alcohol dehydrogenase family) [Candidatus Latescibacterota bacterium]|jgi:NAD(P)-dependent dehydrogenase (short-subunit alcohol dehydrogenase family)
MDQVLAGKVALITGSGRGIGQAIALAYAAHGPQVICSARSGDEIGNTADQIREGSGKIITIGSGMGHKGLANNTAYCCSKAALSMLMRTLAQEVQKGQISVSELIPGPVKTALTGHLHPHNDSAFSIDGEWIKEPADVVPLALFLATQPHIGPTAKSFSLMRRDN